MPTNLIYLLGFALVIVGLSYGAHLMGIPVEWIVAGVIVLAGVSLLKLSKRNRGASTGPS